MLDTFRKTFHLVGRERPMRWVALIGAAVGGLCFRDGWRADGLRDAGAYRRPEVLLFWTKEPTSGVCPQETRAEHYSTHRSPLRPKTRARMPTKS